MPSANDRRSAGLFPLSPERPGAGEWSKHAWLLLPLMLLWIPPGLFGHEPWKPDEGYTIGMVNHIAQTGDWVVPTLVGEPFMEKPPIFFITAALFHKLFSSIMALHTAMALAGAFYVFLAILFCFLAGREAGGVRAGVMAAFGLMGCVGFLVRAHSAITDTALWCGFAVAAYGMILAKRRGMAGAFWFGTGAGLTFMAKGLLGPSFIGVAALLLPFFCPDKRRGYPAFLFLSFAFSLPWLLIWPIALYDRSPELFMKWLWINNFGRFLGSDFGFSKRAQFEMRWGYLAMSLWFALPLWPVALHAVLKKGRAILRDSNFMFPLLIVAVGLILLISAATHRELYLIPLLIPLSLLAAQSQPKLPARLDLILRRVPIVCFGIGLFVIWAFWLMWRTGCPGELASAIERRAPGLESHTGMQSVLLAAAYTLLWGFMFLRDGVCRRGWDSVWMGGILAVWGSALLLYMPILSHLKDYEPTFADMAHVLRNDPDAVISSNYLGAAQQAILEYRLGLRPRDITYTGGVPIGDFFLVRHSRKKGEYSPGQNWEPVWKGFRPGEETTSWYVLYKRRREAESRP